VITRDREHEFLGRLDENHGQVKLLRLIQELIKASAPEAVRRLSSAPSSLEHV
jgi:hypothetical protein